MILVDKRIIVPTTGTRNTAGIGAAVISAPGVDVAVGIAGVRLQSKADGEVTVQIKSGTRVLDEFVCFTKGEGIVYWVPDSCYLLADENTPIYLDLSANIAVGYTLWYYLAS